MLAPSWRYRMGRGEARLDWVLRELRSENLGRGSGPLGLSMGPDPDMEPPLQVCFQPSIQASQCTACKEGAVLIEILHST